MPFNQTDDGYPQSLGVNMKVGRMMIRDLAQHGISGVYTVLWDGDGIVTASMDVKSVRPLSVCLSL